MSDPATPPQISAARAYETLHVPALFAEWAPRLVESAGVAAGERVLDVACGTGILAREAAARCGAASVTGVDVDPGMLSVARDLLPEAEWRLAHAESLPFADSRFDVVLSQFGLMFFADRKHALGEMRRVLAPSGRLALAVWADLESSPPYAAEVELLERLAGERAADALRAPFVLGDAEALATLFTDAGLEAPRLRRLTGRGRFPSVRTMVEADLRGWLPVMGVDLDEETIEAVLADAERVLEPWVTDAGRVEFDSPALVATWRRA